MNRISASRKPGAIMPDELHVALFRGINVGGNNKLPMKTLSGLFVAAGCADVQTYIQSGNVLFRSPDPAQCATTVRAQLAATLNLSIPLVIRSASELIAATTANPFLNRGIDPSWLHVMFLADEPNGAQIAALDPHRSQPDEFFVHGRDIYLHLPNGAARTKLTNAYFDAKLKTVSTQRNWRTMLTLAEMLTAQS